MRSRADARRLGETLLRGFLVGTLAVALWRSLHQPSATPVARATAVRDLPAMLRAASSDARVSSLDVRVDSLPGVPERDWLAALRGAGVMVRWQGTPPSIALEVDRSREPDSRVRLLLAADSGAAFAVTDSAGVVDSLRVLDGGATLESHAVVGRASAARGRWRVSAVVPPAPTPRAVLVLGRAGWESKFVAAALQEAGWTVRARIPAAPGVIVTDPALLPIDSSRYAAVVALDSTAADLAPALARFVAQGGGLVLAGETPALGSLRALAPATTTARLPGRILLDGDSVTRADLPMRPLDAIRPDAVRLEGSAAGPMVAARRAGLGRVLTVGYDESWRWRMLGGASGLAAHRAWWSRVVGLVAPEGQLASAAAAPDAAPTAALFAALGPPTPAAASPTSPGRGPLPLVMLLAVVALLLAETASRRFRGAR